jgi:hypothetical protein
MVKPVLRFLNRVSRAGSLTKQPPAGATSPGAGEAGKRIALAELAATADIQLPKLTPYCLTFYALSAYHSGRRNSYLSIGLNGSGKCH